MADGRCGFDEFDAYVRLQAQERVGAHYHVPIGGSTGLGSLGYVRAALEIDEQARETGPLLLEHLRAAANHTIAPRLLGSVERNISCPHAFLEDVRVVRVDRHTERHGDRV